MFGLERVYRFGFGRKIFGKLFPLFFLFIVVQSFFSSSLLAFSLESEIANTDSPWYVVFVAFVAGLLASLTPCIYPMIPVTVGILQAHGSSSVLRNFLVSVSYVLGIATVYAGLGYLAATSTLIFGQWLSNPFFIFFVSAIFVYLAFSMFGFYEIYIPSFMRGGSNNLSPKGSVLYSYFFGVLSGAAASPCLTPALAILLGYVAKQGSPIFGFATLFAFAIGMGSILILIGTLSASAMAKGKLLPSAGLWMDDVKKFFGFLLLGVMIYFWQPLLSPFVINLLYAVVAAITALFFFVFAKSKKTGWFFAAISLFAVSYYVYHAYNFFHM
jgi:thiol:disulfide interchange protein DsbD